MQVNKPASCNKDAECIPKKLLDNVCVIFFGQYFENYRMEGYVMKKGIAAPVTDAGKRRTQEPLNWVFDEESGKLTISGQGSIPDYTKENPPA